MIEKFLLDRENRVLHQKELLNQFPDKTLVTLKINYPGAYKSNAINNAIIKVIADDILLYYKQETVYNEAYSSLEGAICHFIMEMPYVQTKREMIEIEEGHTLGRCVDIDVYSSAAQSISRTELGIKPRKCFICQNDAHNCSRSQAHSIEQIAQYFDEVYNKHISQTNKCLASIAGRSASWVCCLEAQELPGWPRRTRSSVPAEKDAEREKHS